MTTSHKGRPPRRPIWRLGGLEHAVIAAGSCVSLAVACSPRTHPGDLNDSTFVAVMAALRREVEPGGPETMRDSAGRQSIRDSILRSYHTTAAVLESTASHIADRPRHASDVLRAIDKKVQALGPINTPHPAQPAPAAVPPATSAPSTTSAPVRPPLPIRTPHP